MRWVLVGLVALVFVNSPAYGQNDALIMFGDADANADGELSPDEFGHIPPQFAHCLPSGEGALDFDDWHSCAGFLLTPRSPEHFDEALEIAFNAADLDGDGVLTSDEFQAMPLEIRRSSFGNWVSETWTLEELRNARIINAVAPSRLPLEPPGGVVRDEDIYDDYNIWEEIRAEHDEAFGQQPIESVASTHVIRATAWYYDRPRFRFEIVEGPDGSATLTSFALANGERRQVSSTLSVAYWAWLKAELLDLREDGILAARRDRISAISGFDQGLICTYHAGWTVDLAENGTTLPRVSTSCNHARWQDEVGLFIEGAVRGLIPGCAERPRPSDDVMASDGRSDCLFAQ